MNLLTITVAPVLIILIYVYYRDKYEKEPIALLVKGLILGMVSVIPILFAEKLMMHIGSFIPTSKLAGAFFKAFMVAGLVEEGFKLLAVRMLIWRNSNFNEKFDGIVYAVFVSLGFALVENILYVMGDGGGFHVGLIRAFTAVPAHAMFGVTMGYYLGLAKFIPERRAWYSVLAFFIPFLLHGFYDFILFSELPILLALFIPFLIWMFFQSKKRMGSLSDASVFRE